MVSVYRTENLWNYNNIDSPRQFCWNKMQQWKGILQANYTALNRAPSKSNTSFQLTFKQGIFGKQPRINALKHTAHTVMARE